MNRTRIRLALALACLALSAGTVLRATSVIPISDSELYQRADVIVHGVVLSSEVTVDSYGRPEMLSVIVPLSVVKGDLSGSLVLHQLGGTLPDGRFLKIWGQPEYVPGREVVVFAVRHESGEYQTAELLLGRFEVMADSAGRKFAVPTLKTLTPEGVHVYRRQGAELEGGTPDSESSARELNGFLGFLRSGTRVERIHPPAPKGNLVPVEHEQERRNRVRPMWGNISNSLYRWNNGATAVWTLVNQANITGGGTAEATGALAAWTSEPNSNINYVAGAGSGNTIDLNATSVCGQTGCLAGGGVIGCGGPSGGVSHTWRGDSYFTIGSGFVQLRSYCTFNLYSSAVTQAVLEHELGHTLGLGHSDQNVSNHDVCRGDEDAATMRSVVQNRATLGSDDIDAARWIYGDGLNSCTTFPPTVTGISPTSGSTNGGTLVTIAGTNFAAGATVLIGGVPASNVSVAGPTSLTALSGAHIAGSADVVVTNPDASFGMRSAAYRYGTGLRFYSVPPCRILDTRNATGPYGGPSLVPGTDRLFTVAGQCGIPSTAVSISGNVAATGSTAGPGYVTVSQGDLAAPSTSTVNYGTGQTRANSALIPLGASGDIRARCGQPSGKADMVLDVNGYYQ
ncbi:MAG: IPT/TIG domain-containing protein [Acidobacteriota bacterium]